jgi:hypothetical protein
MMEDGLPIFTAAMRRGVSNATGQRRGRANAKNAAEAIVNISV